MLERGTLGLSRVVVLKVILARSSDSASVGTEGKAEYVDTGAEELMDVVGVFRIFLFTVI